MGATTKKKRRPKQIPAPPRELWDFATCPVEQIRACYLYEYSIESDFVRAEVEAVREKWVLRDSASVKRKIADWWKHHPLPTALSGSPERQDLFRQFKEAIPEASVPTTLALDLHFLFNCNYFPGTHWLKLPSAERRSIAEQFHPDRHLTGSLLDPVQLAERLEAAPMSIETLENFQTSPLFSLRSLGRNYVFSFHWERSNRKLTEDFKRWLEDNRPKDQPGLQLTPQSTSRRTTPKDLLKNLSALRLIRHFQGDVTRARDHYYQLSLEKSLYKDDPALIKAKTKALKEIQRFDTLAK
jgi:hypothetical protein